MDVCRLFTSYCYKVLSDQAVLGTFWEETPHPPPPGELPKELHTFKSFFSVCACIDSRNAEII